LRAVIGLLHRIQMPAFRATLRPRARSANTHRTRRPSSRLPRSLPRRQAGRRSPCTDERVVECQRPLVILIDFEKELRHAPSSQPIEMTGKKGARDPTPARGCISFGPSSPFPGILLHQDVAADFFDALDAGERHAHIELCADDVDCLGHPGFASCAEPENIRAAD
jgi:hypothetical protein